MTGELARLIAGHVFLQASMTGVRMAAPLLVLGQGHSERTVGLLIALFALSQVFLALPAGRYADRHGFKRPMALAVGAAVLGAGTAAAFPGLWGLAIAALLTGGSTGAATIAMQRHVGRAAQGSTQLRQVFSWLAIGPAFSNFLGPLAAGLVIDHAGYRAAFLLLALLPLATWLFARHTVELPPPERTAGAARGRAWDLLREPALRRLMIVNWLLASCWDVHTFVVPVLGHQRGLSASAIGTILGAFAVAAVVVRLLLPLVANRVREWALLVGTMAAAGVLFAVYPLLHGALAMGACSVLLGFALGSVQPMVMSMLHQITPHHRHGEAIALRMLLINSSSVAMPILFGVAGAAIGVAGLFWVAGGVVGFGARLALGLRADRTSG